MNNNTAEIKDYAQRIRTGKVIEAQIIASLRDRGMDIASPTQYEDMHDKIDGWIIDKQNVRHSVQIKYRESGDDIIFEIVKDIDRNLIGRDMESKAQFYIVVDRSGKGRMYSTILIKAMARKMLDMVRKKLSVSKAENEWKCNQAWNHSWDLKITFDKAHGQRKLMAYMNPLMFEVLNEWNNLI
jgi:hypothetical protein